MLKITAMDIEQKVDVLASKKIETRDLTENIYSINQDLQFEMSYGVTKIHIEAFYQRKLGGKTLAFHNDLSLNKLFESEQVSKYSF